jgi:uncharacterized RDD family membrane protein YckC
MSQYGSPPDPNQPDPQQPVSPQDPYGAPPAAAGPYDAPPPAPNPYEAAQQDSYGQAPAQDPYGQPYGAPANPYGTAPAYPQQAALPPGGYAPWIKRVLAYLLDVALSALAAIPLWIGYVVLLSHVHTTTNADGTSTAHVEGSATPAVLLILLGAVTSLAFGIWNVYIRQGRTGYTLGKSALGIRLVSESTGQPIGAFMAFVRQICHILDALPCYLGFLWPLWDRKCQTFADKIMHTLVVNQPTR